MIDDREVTADEGKAFADFYGINFIETSAKNRYNVDESFKKIAEIIYTKVENGEFEIEEGWDGIKKGGTINANGINVSSIDTNNSNSRQQQNQNTSSNCCY